MPNIESKEIVGFFRILSGLSIPAFISWIVFASGGDDIDLKRKKIEDPGATTIKDRWISTLVVTYSIITFGIICSLYWSIRGLPGVTGSIIAALCCCGAFFDLLYVEPTDIRIFWGGLFFSLCLTIILIMTIIYGMNSGIIGGWN